ncbi:MAG TPA: cupin domain-containing protein [Solirubrobacteraceae bacterium]|nr:cupin domain-containing protein [Solirubrobacteraceae bacterium]
MNERVLVTGDESGGALALAEVSVAAGWEGEPLHHHECDETIHVLAGEVTFRLGDAVRTGAESDGRVAVMDNRVGADAGGPPLHRHDFDEAFYVLAGELTFRLGDDRMVRRSGELAFVPRGAAHTFANFSGAEARQLIICTPAGFERYFQRMAAREAGVEPPPEALEPWPEVTTLGPPLQP